MGQAHHLHLYINDNDMDKAIHFYKHVFHGNVFMNDGTAAVMIAHGQFMLKFLDSKSETQEEKQERSYAPRLEYIVDNLNDWVQRFLYAGGQLLTKMPDKWTGTTYAQVIDPFDYIWAFSE